MTDGLQRQAQPRRRLLLLSLVGWLVPAARARAVGERSLEPRVVIHAEAGAEGVDLQTDRLARHLERQGIQDVEIRFVPVAIDTPSIRYFHQEDRLRAEAVAHALEDPSLGGRAWRLRDLTTYRPLPRLGTIEVWLPTS